MADLPTENTLPNPFEIADARAAEYTASEAQREHSDALAKAHLALAEAEDRYSRALSARIKQLHVHGDPESGMPPLAITVCERVAKGEQRIATLRKERDEAKGELAKAEDHSFTLGKDRSALEGLIKWSMHRDLRTDAPPADWRGGEGR